MSEFTVTGVGGTTIDRTRSAEITAVDRAIDDASDVLVAVLVSDRSAAIGGVVRAAAVHADTVLVVDEGDSDETETVASEAGADAVRHPDQRGYGAALRTIFEAAADRDPRHLVIVDADGRHDPDDIASVIAARSQTQADVVFGRPPAGAEQSTLLGQAGSWLDTDETVRIADIRRRVQAYGPRAYHSLASDATVADGASAATDVLYHVVHSGYRALDIGATVGYDLPTAGAHTRLAHAIALVSTTARLGATERPAATVLLPAAVAALADDSEKRGVTRSTALALAGAAVGLLGYVALTRPRTVPDEATRYELQVRRLIEATDGPDAAVDVTAR